jgi:hypothetical protein
LMKKAQLATTLAKRAEARIPKERKDPGEGGRRKRTMNNQRR